MHTWPAVGHSPQIHTHAHECTRQPSAWWIPGHGQRREGDSLLLSSITGTSSEPFLARAVPNILPLYFCSATSATLRSMENLANLQHPMAVTEGYHQADPNPCHYNVPTPRLPLSMKVVFGAPFLLRLYLMVPEASPCDTVYSDLPYIP